MVFLDSGELSSKTCINVMIDILLATFTLIASLTLKDVFTQIVGLITPDHSIKKLIVTLMVALFFFFISILTAYLLQ